MPVSPSVILRGPLLPVIIIKRVGGSSPSSGMKSLQIMMFRVLAAHGFWFRRKVRVLKTTNTVRN